jgi:hypothetical protein
MMSEMAMGSSHSLNLKGYARQTIRVISALRFEPERFGRSLAVAGLE